MLPINGVLTLIQTFAIVVRWSLVQQMHNLDDSSNLTVVDRKAYASVLAISGQNVPNVKTCLTRNILPAPLKTAVDNWNSSSTTEFASSCAWRETYSTDVLPRESCISGVILGHFATLSSESLFSIHSTLRHVIQSLVMFVSDVSMWFCDDEKLYMKIVSILVSLCVDVTCDHLSSSLQTALNRLIPGSMDDAGSPSTKILQHLHMHVLKEVETLVDIACDSPGSVGDQIMEGCGSFLESLLESQIGKDSLAGFLADSKFASILIRPDEKVLASYYFLPMPIVKFLVKLFQLAEKSPDPALTTICSHMSLCLWLECGKLQQWFHVNLLESPPQEDGQFPDSWLLLKNITYYIIRQEETASAAGMANNLLNSLMPLGSALLGLGSKGMLCLTHLLEIMSSLASVGCGTGHICLFRAATQWVSECKQHLSTSLEKEALAATCHILMYMADVVSALKMSSERWSASYQTGVSSPPFESELGADNDSDWIEDLTQDDEESAGEDSDEDSICNKLCTYTHTQKDFINQHWYHCHTCNMVGGVGVCTVCAQVCHKGHDVTYTKLGSFYCDCGAKDDGSCQALVKRSPGSYDGGAGSSNGPSMFGVEPLPSSLRRRPSSPLQSHHMDKSRDEAFKRRQALAKSFEGVRELLTSEVSSSEIAGTVLELLSEMLPQVQDTMLRTTQQGAYQRALSALEQVHKGPKTIELCDQLLIATPLSQEGSFDSVRLNYTVEQGQTIRQLISSSSIRRVVMCCLASPGGKRQHLAIAHEKGKITLLQLSSLLKQQDASKKKLVLTKLSSPTVPFTVLSISANSANDDFLAVCGLKDCHILTFSSSGIVLEHLVLHPQLESGNYIINATWIPGQQTQLALVTADFVKIYNLSIDSLSPQYFFLLPSGKIKDVCFVCHMDSCYLVIMASSGYMYTQELNEESSAQHGPFYITNVLPVIHPDVKDVNSQLCGGGASVYYLHTMQLLCFSYNNGHSFLTPLRALSEDTKIEKLFPITFKASAISGTSGGSGNGSQNGTGTTGGTTSSSSSSNNNKVTPQPLYQWNEVPGHPGFITALTQGNNNAIVLMVKPEQISFQEIRLLPVKSKMTDMVAVRHSWSSSHEPRTSLILLYEDGSLKIYNVNPQTTEYWLSPELQSSSVMSSLRPTRKKKLPKIGKPVGTVSFPVDFFEHCTPLTEVEFGGSDLLQIYNVQQLKLRLNSPKMYVASTKTSGFQMEITNSDLSSVICGIRVAVGDFEIQRIPSFIQVFRRTITINATRNRWYAIPLTREESLQADKHLIITFGPSSDPSGFTIVDSVKVYGKTKEDFGWPEEDEYGSTSTATSTAPSKPTSCVDVVTATTGSAPVAIPLATPFDNFLSAALETLDGCFAATPSEKVVARVGSLNLATKLLNLPFPPSVQHHTRTLLASLHQSKATYHNHKDGAQLTGVIESLALLRKGIKDPSSLDCEMYHRILVITRNIAVARPHNLLKYTEKTYMRDIMVSDERLLAEDQKLNGDSSLSKVSDTTLDSDSTLEGSSPQPAESPPDEESHFLVALLNVFWALHKAKPSNVFLSPICPPGLTYVETTVHAIVEIIHAYTICSLSAIPLAVQLYSELLQCADPCVSFAAKHALVRALRPRSKRRRVYIPSPPRCSTPGALLDGEKTGLTHEASHSPSMAGPSYEAGGAAGPSIEGDIQEALNALGGASGAGSGLGSLGIMDLQPDDDDAMVELAIALSLHEDGAVSDSRNLAQLPSLENLVGELPGLNRLHGLSDQVLHSLLAAGGIPGPGSQSNLPDSQQVDGVAEVEVTDDAHETEHFSDTTASANGSDDDDGEGSTAATDGGSNLMRASPAEHAGSVGSESGGSAIESLGGDHNISGRSSSYGDTGQDPSAAVLREVTSATAAGLMQGELGDEENLEGAVGLHALRISLLEPMIDRIQPLSSGNGVQAIPFFQVILVLLSDLDVTDSREMNILDSLIASLVSLLKVNDVAPETISERTPEKEVQLVVMRMLGVMMSRSKSGSRQSTDNSSVCSHITARFLMRCGVLDHCLLILKEFLPYWQSNAKEQSGTVIGSGLLKPKPLLTAPDMSPFFLRQYVKGHPHDVFATYPPLLTEMALRIPYQMKKLGEGSQLDPSWSHYLCEYTMTQQTAIIRRQVRKLLLYICGHKDKYRQMRDVHALDCKIKDVKSLCAQGGFSSSMSTSSAVSLPYDSLIQIIEHLKACVDIATSRSANWQRYCMKDESVLSFLFEVSYSLEEGGAPTVLQLLQAALCPNTRVDNTKPYVSTSNKRALSEDSETEVKVEKPQLAALVAQINKYLDKSMIYQFTRTFLLESNSTSVRWQAHSLILALYQQATPKDQEALLTMLWSLWCFLPSYGRKAAQFIDLLGYFSLKTKQCEKKVIDYVNKVVMLLRMQSQLLANHPNASLYNSLASLVEFDGYYLESEPCLVCNNPEVPFTSMKLSSIKLDSRYTTTTLLIKLSGSHMISRLNLRITDLKKTKMVRTLNVYYNNRSVQAVVELKNKPSMWYKAKKISLSAGQTEVKVDFPLPIVACNLMFEYADFYENLQASTETLQCPRCSTPVPASPGVCASCGENVYQCHKCRAINYDEKDPFLCNACGYSKYAKFEYTLHCRACCAVDPIENEDDRKKATLNINLLLEKADRSYKQLQVYRPSLESFLLDISEQSTDRSQEAVSSGSSQVNKAIQQLAHKYCIECKNSFDELSRIIQKVQASRRELVLYDHSQKDGGKKAPSSPLSAKLPSDESAIVLGKCYGCVSASTEHCITLLRALATVPSFRAALCQHGLIHDLLEFNLRRGTIKVQNEVRQLLCLLTKDDIDATVELNRLIMEKISLALHSHASSPDLASAVRHEMALLAESGKKQDSCWEHRLRSVVQLFLATAGASSSPSIMEYITLPCLNILQSILKPAPTQVSSKKKDKGSGAHSGSSGRSLDALNAYTVDPKIVIDIYKWISGDEHHTYETWKGHHRRRVLKCSPGKLKKTEVHEYYLMEKYACRWLSRTLNEQYPVRLKDSVWLQEILFNSSSRLARKVAAQMLECVCTDYMKKREILDMLMGFLPKIGSAGENAAEYMSLVQTLLMVDHWKHYLALKGVLPLIASLITAEIQDLTKREESTLSTDLSQGYALKVLTELLSSFIDIPEIKTAYKSKLLGTVLSGYLSLRKLIVQRTKLIDDTQDKFLDLLEDMTSGTEKETEEFMAVCVETVKQYPPDDLRTPVFIFERLCSTIYPEENDVGEFFITLEKDPQQEDFLQGRMVGNPYSSLDPSLGPLIRNIKNKICHDCELVALLEDDNGMELLVCNKIISLDLPVKEVYKKIWLAENHENDAMRIVYRVRGLLGDATEEFVETLDKKKEDEIDNEKVYKIAAVMSKCGGLDVMLECLRRVTDLSPARPLVTVLLKLFQYCVKVRVNRLYLIIPTVGAFTVLLYTLKQCLAAEPEVVATCPGAISLTEQLLMVLEAVLLEASTMSVSSYSEFVETCGSLEDTHLLLNYVATLSRTNAKVRQNLMRVLTFLVVCHKEKVELLVGHFKPVLDFEKFDAGHTSEDIARLESFCVFCDVIERNEIGNQLKDMILKAGVVKDALTYIKKHIPQSKKLVVVCDDEWKEFLSKPALKHVLRLLTGLSSKHPGTQQAVAEDCIPAIHRLEQISSDEHVGSLAENLLEALKDDPSIAHQVQEVRRLTRQEKKNLAMKSRKKELSLLGLRANEKQQITSQSAVLQQMGDIAEEAGLVCAICLEGYKCQPQKVLGIYTYSKRCVIDEYENKQQKTLGYCTVTHFNVVHVDCHLTAVRSSRSRDEWESAALHNANTKANGLLPLWGPLVPESAFASCLARHNTYLQECTTHRDIHYSLTIHDLKLLILRFSTELTFSEDCGGGGPQSNMNIIPYILHVALYVMNTTHVSCREEEKVEAFFETRHDRWVESCFGLEGPFFIITLLLTVWQRDLWLSFRLRALQRLMATAHVRGLIAPGAKLPTERKAREWPVYKVACIFWALIDGLYRWHFKKVAEDEGLYSSVLADFIRHNDQHLLESSNKLLHFYQEELLPCASFSEFCDVVGLLGEIENPDGYTDDLLKLLY